MNAKTIDRSSIEWCGPTWNPHQGCTKKTIKIDGVIELRKECENCYMYRDKKRYGQKPQVVIRSSPATFNKPRKWQREVEAGIRRGIDRLVFTSSWTDFFNPEADSYRLEEWQIMRECPGLIFQVLTKLTDRIESQLPPFWDEIKGRVWMGTSAGYQPALDWAAPYLVRIDSAVRFLSCEPLFGELDLIDWIRCHPCGGSGDVFIPSGVLDDFFDNEDFQDCPICEGNGFDSQLDWVIGGGESGPNARPTHIQAARSLRDQCQAAAIPFFWKQWGEFAPVFNSYVTQSGYDMQRVGKKSAGRLLDDKEWSQFPLDKLPEQIADEIRQQQGIND